MIAALTGFAKSASRNDHVLTATQPARAQISQKKAMQSRSSKRCNQQTGTNGTMQNWNVVNNEEVPYPTNTFSGQSKTTATLNPNANNQ